MTKIFQSDLKKVLPRILFVEKTEDFWVFSKVGRKLANLHLNYENMEPYPDVRVVGIESNNFVINKLTFGKKR